MNTKLATIILASALATCAPGAFEAQAAPLQLHVSGTYIPQYSDSGTFADQDGGTFDITITQDSSLLNSVVSSSFDGLPSLNGSTQFATALNQGSGTNNDGMIAAYRVGSAIFQFFFNFDQGSGSVYQELNDANTSFKSASYSVITGVGREFYAVNNESYQIAGNFSDTPSTVPLPATLPSFGGALLALGLLGYRFRKHSRAGCA